MEKNSYTYDELISCGEGKLFGEGNAKLPLPPMLMFDRITEIKKDTGEFKKGYLKEIPINSNQTYFDTNVTDHHHFFDVKEEKLIDLKNEDVGPIEIQKSIPGKKIKSVEVLVKLED